MLGLQYTRTATFFFTNRSRSKGLTSDGKGILNRRISNKEQQNVEGSLTSPLDIRRSIFCGSFLLGMIGERCGSAPLHASNSLYPVQGLDAGAVGDLVAATEPARDDVGPGRGAANSGKESVLADLHR